jgi:hypothetical protein
MNGEEGALKDVLVFLKSHNLTRNFAEKRVRDERLTRRYEPRLSNFDFFTN